MSTERPPPRPEPRRKPDLGAIERLARDALTSPRSLTTQILDHLLSCHEVTVEQVTEWLRTEIARLESYELDLLLSPLFTPDLEAQLRFEELLGDGHLDAGGVEALIERLAAQALRLVAVHAGESVEFPLPRVVIERFVRLLHLDAPLPEEAALLSSGFDAQVRVQLRDRAWRRLESRRLLPALLAAVCKIDREIPAYVHFLTDFVRSYRPASREECVRFLSNFAEACETDLKKYRSGERSFFNPELKAAYAGKWKVGEDVVAAHERMIAMAGAVKQALG